MISHNLLKMVVKPKIYSFSRLGTFENCEASYKLGYIDKVENVDNFWSSLGSISHSIIEEVEQGKIQRSQLVYEFTKRYGEMPVQAPFKAIATNAYNGLHKYFSNYKGFSTKNLVIEEEFYVKFDHFWLRGYIDMYGNDKDGNITIIDHKISNPKGSSWETEKKIRQLYLYSSYIWLKFGKFPKWLVFNFIKENTYIREPFDLDKFKESVQWMKDTVKKIEDAENNEGYVYNANFSDFFCSNICGVRNSCPFYQKKDLLNKLSNV